MLDLTAVRRRFYEVKPWGSLRLALKPVSLKLVRQIAHIVKLSGRNDPAALDELPVLVARLLSANRSGYKVSAAQVYDHLDYDQIAALLAGYFGWLQAEKSDPN